MGGGAGAGRKEKPRRTSSELHFGYNYSRGHIPNVGASAGHSRLFLVVFVLFLAAILVAGVLATREEGFDIVETLFAAGALGRGVTVLIGFVALPAVLIYYYSAGIDWPFDEASRLVMIGAMLGFVLCAAVMLIGHVEGWMDWRASRLWIVAAVLLALGIAGYVGQRSS